MLITRLKKAAGFAHSRVSRLPWLRGQSSGASLILVLGVMTLLFAVASTTILAAGATVGSDLKRQSMDILELKVDSLQNTLGVAFEDVTANGLGNKVLSAVVPSALEPDGSFELELNPVLNRGQGNELSGLDVVIRIVPAEGYSTILSGASINGVVEITVTGSAQGGRQKVSTVAKYDLVASTSGSVSISTWEVKSYDKVDM